ncbi:nuclear pore complex protein NUP96-like isoform X2 [Durio zibethinus]|uniref:Nuclear pore complex protein NUP96-like isoform X2 n=1 Tax=Durio zibethinus TaxID=66656 RepID=A0A6P5WFV1_DURZI|nr:nuclear pore complex protein NUP96-like isoform X2 [Durio zibethinus]
MASASLLPPSGTSSEIRSAASDISRSGTDLNAENCDLHVTSLYKRRRISATTDFLSHDVLRKIEESLPSFNSPDYYMEPCLKDMATMELLDPGYCSRVPDFVVGRFGYGCVKFFGTTDVRGLDLDQIVKFRRHEVIVYEDERNKPMVGQGLNKTAKVTLRLKIENIDLEKQEVDGIVKKLRESMRRQGAQFITFDPANGEWKFLVDHFSRFGLSEDEEEDILMDDATGVVQDPGEINGGGNSEIDEEMQMDTNGPLLSHSLPAHLGLDPVKMKEMRMLMFPVEEEEELEDFRGTVSNRKQAFAKEFIRSPLLNSNQRMGHRSSPPVVRKTPVALLDYNSGTFGSNSSGTVLMTQENKGMPLKTIKKEGFKLDIKQETPVTRSHSRNIVDAALFMGRSFRVGWGPNGILVHSGAPVGSKDTQRVLSSVINIEKVAIDNVVRDENNKVKKELVDFAFDSPLNLHKALNYEEKEVEVGFFQLKLLNVVCNRLELSEICRSYIDIIERQLEVPGLSSSARLVLMHQVMVWELIKVLFSERENTSQLKSMGADNEEDMMHDIKEGLPEVDPEALPLIRRAEFSCWLQESVCHRVQEEVSSVNDSGYLEHLFFLLTGRQLDAAVELAASRGDVRLACLLSQAGGSTVNRSDVAQQLDIWRINGLDFNFIEKGRIRLYELLAGNIHGALHGIKIDWKRFLGLLMWYHLPADTALPVVFQTYQHLLDGGKAPFPVPIYIDEGPVEENANWSRVERFDLSYYLMLLHASEESQLCSLKTMFSTFSSTHDPLDYHMIWHQRAILEAIGAFHSNDLQALDMGLVSQLLCQGQCHWAIYVALHMPYCDEYPYLQAILIREILFQYCESWSLHESQRQFIEDLGIPLQWLHEAMAVYFNYHGDLPKALEHFLECANWRKAHSIFMTSVAHTLFLSANHSEVWRIATSMEDHKSEIENWDLGAGIYISFYVLRSSLQEDNSTMGELDSLDSKNAACRDFLGRLNESLAIWGGRLPVDSRVAYSKMAEEMCDMLLSDMSEGPTRDAQLSCFDTVFSAPLPEDLRSNHLQDAVALFTCHISEAP